MNNRIAMIAACVAATSGLARADYSSQFDNLAPGVKLAGVGGWQGWDNVNASAGVVSSDIAYSGANSIKIQGYTDAVYKYANVTSGTWTLEAKQFIAAGQSGQSYFIVMNDYIDGQNWNAAQWSTQLRFDLAGGRVYDDFRGGSVAINAGQWSDIRLNINLDANTVSSYYNGNLISSGSWTTGGGSKLAISALDLYSADRNIAYYDAIDLSSGSRSVPSTGSLTMCTAASGLILVRKRRA